MLSPISNESFLIILYGEENSLLKVITSQVFLCKNFLLYENNNKTAVRALLK